MGGDWNCCTDFTLDRTGEEPHFQSSAVLSCVLKTDLVDVWRMKHPSVRQYTWVKITDGRVSAARLDRFYVSGSFTTRVVNCQILPVVFTDHHLIVMELILSPTGKPKSFWHFNVKLLHDKLFCGNSNYFGSTGDQGKMILLPFPSGGR